MSSFPDVKSAVDAVVEILQCGLPMARIGKLCLENNQSDQPTFLDKRLT